MRQFCVRGGHVIEPVAITLAILGTALVAVGVGLMILSELRDPVRRHRRP